MKKPQNIEALLVDYAEGKLDSSQLLIVEKWLSEHPEDMETVLSWDISGRIEEEVSLNPKFKSSLKSNLGKDSEDLMIQELEGSISNADLLFLDKECTQSVVLQKERSLYALTKLDYERDKITLENKASLRKGYVIPIGIQNLYRVAVAASFIAFLFWFNLPDNNSQYKLRSAELMPSVITFSEESPSPPATINQNATQTELANNQSSIFEESENKKETPLGESLDRMELKNIKTIPAPQQNLQLAYSTFANSKRKDVIIAKSSDNEYNGLVAFLKASVIKRLVPNFEGKSSKEIFESELAKASDGKYAVNFDNGKLVAINSPVISWKK